MADNYLNKTGLQYFYNRIKTLFAPTSHASTATTYGIGTSANYGHVKLSDATNGSAAAAGDGTAATPKAVADALTAATSAIPSATTTSPKMDGTATVGTETKWAKGDHVHPTDTSRAPLASPALTGTPTAPTAATGTNTTQIATTAFVKTAVDNVTVADFTPPTSSAAGTHGLVPAPPAGQGSELLTGQGFRSFGLIIDGDLDTLVGGRSATLVDDEILFDVNRATDSQYGLVKLSDSTSSSSAAASGYTAATPKAVADVKAAIPSASSTTPSMDGTAAIGTGTTWARADHVHPTDTSRAPTSHASTATTYGAGNASSYGHVKLSDATNGTAAAASGGTAATPKAVADVKAAIPSASSTTPSMDGTAAAGTGTTWARADHVHPTDTSRAPTSHASTATTYGKGTGSNYGHVKLSDSADTDEAMLYQASDGVAATPTAVYEVFVEAKSYADGLIGDLQNTWYGTSTTAGATQVKEITTADGDFSFDIGSMLRVKFNYGHTYNGAPKLKVDGGSNYDVALSRVLTNTPTLAGRYLWRSGEVVDFVFDGNYFIAVGKSQADGNYPGIVTLSDSTSTTSSTVGASSTAVKAAYDLANGRAPLASPEFTGTPTAPTAASGTNTTQIATTAFVQTALESAQVGAAMFKGTVNANTDISGLSSYKNGWYWVVATAGTYVGETCEVGDMIFCVSDRGSAYAANDFSVVQSNLDLTAITTAEIDVIVAS